VYNEAYFNTNDLYHIHIVPSVWYGSAFWYNPSKVRFRFWRKIFYRLVLRYWT
jgi:hypothetical protein